MKLIRRKIVWISYIVFFVISASLLVYTDHAYFNVSHALRLINLEVNNFYFVVNKNASIVTNFMIHNPSDCQFVVSIIKERIYLNSLDDNGYIYNEIKFGEFALERFSRLVFVFNIPVPEHKYERVISALNESNSRWFAIFDLTIKNPFFEALTLNFVEELGS